MEVKKKKNFELILKTFSTYLFVNFTTNLILIIFHFDTSSIGSILFTVISGFLPFISLIETFVNYKKCLKFLEDASEIRGQLISRKIVLKVSFILLVMVVQLVIIFIRAFSIQDMRYYLTSPLIILLLEEMF
jgi:hypothetical protein